MYLEPEYAKSRITDFGFKELVVLPREIDLNEWLASNSAWGWGGARAGRPLVSPETPELVLSILAHKLTDAEARDGQPTEPWGPRRDGDSVGVLVTPGVGHQGQGKLWDASVVAGPRWGGPRPGGWLPPPASQARGSARRTPPQGRVPALLGGEVISVAASWCCRPC